MRATPSCPARLSASVLSLIGSCIRRFGRDVILVEVFIERSRHRISQLRLAREADLVRAGERTRRSPQAKLEIFDALGYHLLAGALVVVTHQAVARVDAEGP